MYELMYTKPPEKHAPYIRCKNIILILVILFLLTVQDGHVGWYYVKIWYLGLSQILWLLATKESFGRRL